MVERTGSGVPVRAFIEDDLVVFSGIAGQKNHRVFAGVTAVGNHKAQGACKKIHHCLKMADPDLEMAQ